jgi:hypothetical protein
VHRPTGIGEGRSVARHCQQGHGLFYHPCRAHPPHAQCAPLDDVVPARSGSWASSPGQGPAGPGTLAGHGVPPWPVIGVRAASRG